jgi:L-amino acid N-acyltransferase YncA
MDGSDGDTVLAFARSLPEHDLLFLRRDITQPDQVAVWVQRVETDAATSLLLTNESGEIAGYATVDRNDLAWSQHVAELRVLVGPDMRGHGVGRLLTEEAFRIALGMSVDKIIGQMTVDQHQAIAVFRSLGFQPEALLRDHVKDREGNKHDLVILSHDVAAAQRTMAAVGVLDAVSDG